MFSKLFSRFTRKRTPTKSKTSTQKSPMRVVHVEEPVPTLPEAVNTTLETIANLKEEKVRIKNNLSAQEKIVNEAQAELDNANDYNREQKRKKLNQVTHTKNMLTKNLNHFNVQISNLEKMNKAMNSMAQHSIKVGDLNSRAGKRKLRNKTKGGMFKRFRKNSTGTKKKGMFSMFSRIKTPSTRMSTNTLTPDEEAYVDREIAILEQKEEQEREQQDLKNQQQDLERKHQEIIAAMNRRAPIDYGTDKELLEELENLAGTRKKRKSKKHKKKH